MVIIGFSQKCKGGRHICKVTNQSKFTLSSGNDVFGYISYLEKDFFGSGLWKFPIAAHLDW